MKPGGLCSPTDGSSMPSGDTLNSLSTHKSPEKGEHHSETSSACEGHANLSAQQAGGHQQLTNAANSHSNGMFPHDDIPNGMLTHSKSPPVPRRVLLPLHGEDLQGKGSAHSTASLGKEESGAAGTMADQSFFCSADASTSSKLPHSLSNVCSEPFHQLTVITSPTGYSSACTAPYGTGQHSSGILPVSPKFVSPGQSVSPKGVCLTSPKSLKSPKGRRKFSLEEMVTKLHNRTESFRSGVSVLPFPTKSVLSTEVALKNNADAVPVDRKASLLVTGNLSDSTTPCQSGISSQIVCDNNNTARICDAHPTVNQSVSDASITLHNKEIKCITNTSCVESDAKTKVDSVDFPEKTIASEEVNMNTKVQVMHLDKCHVSHSPSDQNALEGNHKQKSMKSSMPSNGGNKERSGLDCNEVSENAQYGTMLNECSSQVVVQQCTHQANHEKNEVSQICTTDGPSTACDVKAGEPLPCKDLPCTGISESICPSSVDTGNKLRLDIDSTCRRPCENRECKTKERTNNESSKVSEAIENENNKVNIPCECRTPELTESGQKMNSELQTQSSGVMVQKEHVGTANLLEKDIPVVTNTQGDKELTSYQHEPVVSEKKQDIKDATNEQCEEEVQVSEDSDRVPGEQQCDTVLSSECQKDMDRLSNRVITNKLVDLTAESESVRSSSVEIIENESLDNADSESEIEILYEKKDESELADGKGKDLSTSGEALNSDRSREETLSYLEPISDDENSLLCDPSTSSGLSSVSGFQSNSDTPMFSDTPSDASRGAIMVRISDAVAALLSDVSDASLPDSPLSFSDKTQGSSEKADEVIFSNTNEETYANSETLQARPTKSICSGESAKDFKGLINKDLKEGTVRSASSIVESHVGKDSCKKGEEGPKSVESNEKLDSTKKTCVMESNERRFQESQELGSNICRLASSTSAELSRNSEEAVQGQKLGLEVAFPGNQHLEQSTPSDIGTQSGDMSSISTATHSISPTDQFSQLPELSGDRNDSQSSHHSQVPVPKLGTNTCCSLFNDSSHICQNLISGSLNISSQNQNCNNISQNGGNKNQTSFLNTQPSAISHDSTSIKNTASRSESDHTEQEPVTSSSKERIDSTCQFVDRAQESLQLEQHTISFEESPTGGKTTVQSPELKVESVKGKLTSESNSLGTEDERKATSLSNEKNKSKLTFNMSYSELGDQERNSGKITVSDTTCELENSTTESSLDENVSESDHPGDNSVVPSEALCSSHTSKSVQEESLGKCNLPKRASKFVQAKNQPGTIHCQADTSINSSFDKIDASQVHKDTNLKVCEPNTGHVLLDTGIRSSASLGQSKKGDAEIPLEVKGEHTHSPLPAIINDCVPKPPVDIGTNQLESIATVETDHECSSVTVFKNMQGNQDASTFLHDESNRITDSSCGHVQSLQNVQGVITKSSQINSAEVNDNSKALGSLHVPPITGNVEVMTSNMEYSQAEVEKPGLDEEAVDNEGSQMASRENKFHQASDVIQMPAEILESQPSVAVEAGMTASKTSEIYHDAADACLDTEETDKTKGNETVGEAVDASVSLPQAPCNMFAATVSINDLDAGQSSDDIHTSSQSSDLSNEIGKNTGLENNAAADNSPLKGCDQGSYLHISDADNAKSEKVVEEYLSDISYDPLVQAIDESENKCSAVDLKIDDRSSAEKDSLGSHSSPESEIVDKSFAEAITTQNAESNPDSHVVQEDLEKCAPLNTAEDEICTPVADSSKIYNVDIRSECPVEEPVESAVNEHAEIAVSEHIEGPVNEHAASAVAEHAASAVAEHAGSAVDEHAESLVDQHTESAVNEHTKSAVDQHTESAVDMHTESAVDMHTESAVDMHTESAVDMHTEREVDMHTESAVDMHTEREVDEHAEIAVDEHAGIAVDEHAEGAVGNHMEGAVDDHMEGAFDEPTEGAVNKHGENAVNKHSESAVDEQAESAVDEHAESAANEHAESATDELAESAADELAESAADELAESAADEHAESTADEHAESAADEHAESVADEHAESEAHKHAESAADEHAESAADEHHESAADEHHESAADEHHESAADEHHESAADEHAESAADEHAESATDEHAENAIKEYAESAGDKHSESAVDEHSESAVDEHSESAVDEHSESAVDEHSESAVNEHTESAVDEHAESAVVEHTVTQKDGHQAANVLEGIPSSAESSVHLQSSKIGDENLSCIENLEGIHSIAAEGTESSKTSENEHSQSECGLGTCMVSDSFDHGEQISEFTETNYHENQIKIEDTRNFHAEATKASLNDTDITDAAGQGQGQGSCLEFNLDVSSDIKDSPPQVNEEESVRMKCKISGEIKAGCGDRENQYQIMHKSGSIVNSQSLPIALECGDHHAVGIDDHCEAGNEEQSTEKVNKLVGNTVKSSDHSQHQQICQVVQSHTEREKQPPVNNSLSAIGLEEIGEANMKPESEFLGTLCPLCMKLFDKPLETHLLEVHICNYFIPAKRTQAYRLHMLQRVQDISFETEVVDTQEFVYVCQSCQFASKDINAVRFHVNIHEDVYQANPGKVSCECNEKKYSYPFHKWKYLLHRSTYECNVCKFYFSCENGLVNHLKALHFSGSTCKNCNVEISEESLLTHQCLLQSKDIADESQEESSLDKFELSWNIYDNYVNYLDGKDFRLNTSSKVLDTNLDRSYLKLPIKNVLHEAVVPDEVKLDPGKDIGKYLKGKKSVKLSLDEESYGIVKNFTLSVQMELEKKLARKGRRGQGVAPRVKREDDLFDILGIGTVRSRGTVKKDCAESTVVPRTKRGRSRVKQETLKEEIESHGQDLPSLTRTRSGMQPFREESERSEEILLPPLDSEVAIDGEWTKNHTYICCSCGAGYLDLADMMDHKWESHPSVWCAHTMIQGQEGVPSSFCKQYQPPTSQPHKLPLPGTTLKQTPSRTPSRRNSDAHSPALAEKSQDICSLCKLEFQDRNLFHAHLVECGGLNYVATSKKNKKKGFRFKRRKGQGIPSNRYGNSSQPGTPLKAKPGDRSSGLNTPQLDRAAQSTVQSSGVKRRLELAVGSIDNAELKNRLKAIITGARKSTGNTTSSRRTRMKLRKKALEMKRLRKTRHSDRVKENVSNQSEKGKEEDVKEKDKKVKEESLKGQNRKSREDSLKFEEGKDEENTLKSGGKKGKGGNGGKHVKEVNEGAGRGGEKKEKVASGKVIKDNSGDSEMETVKKTGRKRGSGEKESKQPKVAGEKGQVVKKKQLKVGDIEPVRNINELSTKPTSEIADIISNTKMSKKSKSGDAGKDSSLSDKRVQSLKKINGVVSNKDLVSKRSKVKIKTKVCASKVGRKSLSQISAELIAEQNSQKRVNISDKKDLPYDEIQKSGSNQLEVSSSKKVKGRRASVDSAIVKNIRKEGNPKKSKKKSGVVQLSMEKEVGGTTHDSERQDAVQELITEKNVMKSKKIREKKISTNKKELHNLENSDVMDRTAKGENLKYKAVRVQESQKIFDSEDSRDVVTMNLYHTSSDDTEGDSDSEPEVSHNFRTGRRCGGRMGLRSKRKPQNTRYSFRSCLIPTDGENEDVETQSNRRSVTPNKTIDDARDELPLTPKRKRKIANYEDDDDFTYMPSGNSTDLDEESSDGVEESIRETCGTLRKRRKMVIPSSDSEAGKPPRRILHRRGSSLTSEGDTFDDSYDEGTLKNIKLSRTNPVDTDTEVHIERRVTKKKNLRLQSLVSLSSKKQDNLGSKLMKKPRDRNVSKTSVLGSSEDDRNISQKQKIRKFAIITDDSQESESTADDDYLGKKSLVNLPSKRKKTTKKSFSVPVPPSDTKVTDSSHRYEDDDDDDEDNIPLATIAQLKGQSLPRRIAMSNIIKEKVRAVAARNKNIPGFKKHVPLKTLPKQIIDAGTADSESSGFEGFVPVSLKKNKRRVGIKYKTKNMVSHTMSENDVDTSSNTELSTSPKPKRKCTVSKKVEKNETEVLVSKGTKDCKIFNIDSDVEENSNVSNLQTKEELGCTDLKTEVQKSRKYVRKSTETGNVMPVLEPVSLLEPGSETMSTDTGEVLSSSEDTISSRKQPAKVRRRRSSVEKIKDIPTRSSAMLLQENPTPPELKAVSTDDKISDNSSSVKPGEKLEPIWENKKPVISEERRKRSKSSHELLPRSESVVKVPESIPKENSVISSVEEAKVVNVPKKTKRKRAVSVSGVPGVEKAVNLKSPLRVNVEGVSTKKNSEGQKRKKNVNKDDMNDLKCVDCGLRFGSVASLEDHQQDCVTIAFEMSLMEAEDHLFECPHCHLTFALKGTQRKHTTSCRMAKSKRTPHRNDVKAMKRVNRTPVPQSTELPDTADTGTAGGQCQGAHIKSRRRSKENVASDDGVNAASPLKDSSKQNFVSVSEVPDKSDNEKPTEKGKKVSSVPYGRSNSKVRKELQTNGQLENFEGVDLFCLTKIDGVQKCLVCGYEVTDKESCDKHQLLQQFTHHCQQKTVVEVCALLTNYNLGIDTVRTLITSASILHGSTVLNLDAKQQCYPESNAVLTSTCAVQLKELLNSPHCTWIVSVLDTITSHHRTSKTVSISGTRQEALKAVTALEELLKEISEIDNSIKKNQMLKSMRETFEAGT